MKKNTYRMLIIFSIFIFNTGIKAISQVKSISKQEDLLKTSKKDKLEKVKRMELSGNYKLKYRYTLKNRKWKTETTVGLDFIPSTYLYSVGNLNFDLETSEVVLSSISIIKNLPSSEFGTYPFKINNNKLTITYDKDNNNCTFVIRKLTNKKLILENVRTKCKWQFEKN